MATPDQRTVLIVGASSSIGEAVAQAFLDRGYLVLATHRRDPVALNHPNLRHACLDLVDPSSLDRFADQEVIWISPIHDVVLLAGLLPGLALEDYDDTMIDHVIAVNFTGPAKLIRRIQPRLNNPSQVLMMSSISAERGSFDPIYAAGKGAVISFVKSLACWMAPATRANGIAPGLIEDTTMFNEMAADRRDLHRRQTPMKQLLRPDHLGPVIADLFEPHWNHLNGVVVRLNGGAYV